VRSFNIIRSSLLIAFLICLYPLSGWAQEAGRLFSPVPDKAASVSGSLQSLKNLFGGDSEPELLPPEQAFTVKLRVKDATSLVAEFTPAKGYYLYRDRISFKIVEPATVKVTRVKLPQGEMKSDPTFGKVEVYHTPFDAIVSLERPANAVANGRLHFSYQGCSDSGVCYPPIDRTFDFALPAMLAADGDQMNAPSSGQPSETSQRSADNAPAGSEAARGLSGLFDPDSAAALFEASSFWWVVAGFFGFGLLLSLTPCVWPMFPILSGIIAGQGASISKTRAFWLSASYVLGMAVTYAAVGIAAGLTGSLLSNALQTPWALAAMATLFVVLALSMFGLYELQLPAFLQSRVATASNRISKRTSASVFAMGVVSAIIVGPCIAAPLAGALLYIGQTQDVVLGGTALFAMALGKGVPLLAVGTSLGSLMPRAGNWMKSIKVFLGVLLLAAALWTISPFIPLSASMALAGVILIVYAIYLRAFDALPADAGGVARFGKGVGVIGLLIGSIYVVGAFSGSRNFFQPLSHIGGNTGVNAPAPLPFQRIKSVAELDAKLLQADGRYVMLDFYADWCVSCKEMEHFTLSDPAVRARLQNVVLLQADVTKNSAEDKQLLARFGLFGPPGILFFDQAGQEIKRRRVIGFMDADRFTRVLNEVFPQH
jgi:thiol:disulfide interchange protein DsbD